MQQSPADGLLGPTHSHSRLGETEEESEELESERYEEAGVAAASGLMASASSFMMPPSTSAATAGTAHASTAPALPRLKIFAFGLGHVLNDMTASCWFSYLLVLMHKVLGFSSWKSACILLSGQLADAVATPLVGIFSDRAKGITCGSFYFGRRHLVRECKARSDCDDPSTELLSS